MIDITQVTACLVSKDHPYPKEVLDHVSSFPFAQIIVMTESDSPHRKHDLFAMAKTELLYCQDDDAIAPIQELAELSDPTTINLATKQGHYDAYKDKRTAVGFGWGCFFPRSILASLKAYTDVYGEDQVYKRETERILMCLNYPQNRFVLPIRDLPSAMAPDRLSMQPGHYDYIPLVEERCAEIIRTAKRV